jgi:hypothetical protein
MIRMSLLCKHLLTINCFMSSVSLSHEISCMYVCTIRYISTREKSVLVVDVGTSVGRVELGLICYVIIAVET